MRQDWAFIAGLIHVAIFYSSWHHSAKQGQGLSLLLIEVRQDWVNPPAARWLWVALRRHAHTAATAVWRRRRRWWNNESKSDGYAARKLWLTAHSIWIILGTTALHTAAVLCYSNNTCTISGVVNYLHSLRHKICWSRDLDYSRDYSLYHYTIHVACTCTYNKPYAL